MYIYEKKSYINTTLEELYNFHHNPDNLIKITPPNISAKLLTKDVEPKEGAVLMIKTIKNFIPFTWVVRIKKVEYPKMFIDEALKSPFSFWEHQHIFQEVGNKVLLKDIVKYKLPLGFLGKLFKNFIQRDIENMFNYRHKITKNILEEGK